jgi:hypothetical protein
MGTYAGATAVTVGVIGGIFIGIALLDLCFYFTDVPSVGWRIRNWSQKNPLLSGAILLIYAMLVTHFVANPIGT